MLHLVMAGVSERHRSTHERPNEDAFITDAEHGIAVVGDGVTRPRTREGAYPAESAAIAAHSFVNAVAVYLKAPQNRKGKISEVVRAAMCNANDAIALENASRHITETVDFEYSDYLGTTGCVLWIPPHRKTAVVGYIGDAIALKIHRNGAVSFLTRDQLIPCHRYTLARFGALVKYTRFGTPVKGEGTVTPEEASRQRLVWQRQHARNNTNARDPEGNRIGFGVLTGESGAVDFIETTVVRITCGDRFVLASDGLRICIRQGDTVRKTADSLYADNRRFRGILTTTDPKEAIKHVIRGVRNAEWRIGTISNSDDATAVIVRIT